MRSVLGVDYDVVERRLSLGGQDWALLLLRDFEATVDQLWSELCRGPDGSRRFEDLVPMFGWLWPSAQVLADAMSGHVPAGCRVLELGCGLGLPSLVAARAGARVVATDLHPDAPAFFARNLHLNGLSDVPVLAWDWRTPAPPEIPERSFDWVVASDVLYDVALAELLARTIDRFLAPDGTAWVTDPGRPWLEAFEQACVARGLVPELDVHRTGEAEAFLLRLGRRDPPRSG